MQEMHPADLSQCPPHQQGAHKDHARHHQAPPHNAVHACLTLPAALIAIFSSVVVSLHQRASVLNVLHFFRLFSINSATARAVQITMHTMHTTDKNSNNFDSSQCHQIEPLLLSKAYLLLVQELCNRAIAASNLMGKAPLRQPVPLHSPLGDAADGLIRRCHPSLRLCYIFLPE